MARTESQESRDRLVHGLLKHLERSGFARIAADVVDYDAPSIIPWTDMREGHIPAATAEKDGVGHLFEVATSDTVAILDTARQWKLSDKHARRFGKKFVVVVPLGCGGVARQQLDGLGIRAAVWEIKPRRRET